MCVWGENVIFFFRFSSDGYKINSPITLKNREHHKWMREFSHKQHKSYCIAMVAHKQF